MGAPMGTPTPFVSQPAVNPAQGGKGASSSPSGSYSQMFANPAANQFGASPNTRYVPKQYTASTLSPPVAPTAPLAPGVGDNNYGNGNNGPSFGMSGDQDSGGYSGDGSSYGGNGYGTGLGGSDHEGGGRDPG